MAKDADQEFWLHYYSRVFPMEDLNLELIELTFLV